MGEGEVSKGSGSEDVSQSGKTLLLLREMLLKGEGVAREHSRLARRTLEIVLADKEMRSYVPGNALIKG